MKRKVIECLVLSFVLSAFVTGCRTKETKVPSEPVVSQYSQETTSEPAVSQDTVLVTEGAEVDKTHRDRELFVVEGEPVTFSLGGEKIKVKDSKGVVNAITNVEWINSEQIAVEGHINPSKGYFTVYDVPSKKVTYEAYGYGFVWKDADIRTLVYIQAPPHFSRKGGTYYIMNYEGKELYQSKDELMELGFDEDGDITFEVMKEDGMLTKEKIKG